MNHLKHGLSLSEIALQSGGLTIAYSKIVLKSLQYIFLMLLYYPSFLLGVICRQRQQSNAMKVQMNVLVSASTQGEEHGNKTDLCMNDVKSFCRNVETSMNRNGRKSKHRKNRQKQITIKKTDTAAFHLTFRIISKLIRSVTNTNVPLLRYIFENMSAQKRQRRRSTVFPLACCLSYQMVLPMQSHILFPMSNSQITLLKWGPTITAYFGMSTRYYSIRYAEKVIYWRNLQCRLHLLAIFAGIADLFPTQTT